MLEFDEKTARLLEIVYQGADATARRRANFDALAAAPGDTVVDIGCGNGMLTAELARAVGPEGRVIGVDPSAHMRKPAAARCGEFDWVEIVEGAADALPLADGAADKAVSVQVFEYLSDIPAAVAETHRVLRPGGRLTIGDIHFDSLAWHSDDPARMQRIIDAWDHHFTERRVPARLPPILRDAGFELEGIVPATVCDWQLRPDGLASMMIRLMSRFASKNDLVPADEAGAWAEEQEALAAVGRFFFSLTHFVTVARKA